MSTYAASIAPNATSAIVNISPSSTYQVRIAKVEFCATNASLVVPNTVVSVSFGVWVCPSATLSGGTTVTPVRMGGGGPVAAATVKSGGTVTGTSFQLHGEGNVSSNTDQVNNVTIVAQLNSSYTPAFELIVANGSIFQAGGTASPATSLNVIVYFEEIRTPRTL